MPCYYPIDAWPAKKANDSGKFSLVFNLTKGRSDEPVKIPCNKCIGCRLDQSQAWGIRCLFEMKDHPDNCFLTLTYDEEHLPSNKSLDKKHLRDFIKNLRYLVRPKKIRFFACGEYGTDQDASTLNHLGRPHYHAIIFNHDFKDKTLHKTIRDNKLYTSESLSNLWKKGIATVQDANLKTAQYTAGYITKKIGGDMAETHYQIINPITGEITHVHPEFMSCSKMPGIGHSFADKYLSDCDKGYLTIKGDKHPIPNYFKDQIKKRELDTYYSPYQFQKDQQINRVDSLDRDFTLDRLRVKEKIKLIRTKKLTERNYLNEN